MKTKLILLAVCLLAIGLLWRAARPAPEKRPAGQPQSQEAAGVALPPEAAAPPEAQESDISAPACSGGSFREILSAHGRTWGFPRPGGSSFSDEQSAALYALLTSYYSCKAAVSGDLGECDFTGGSAGGSVDRFNTPSFLCRERAAVTRMLGVMAGRDKQVTGCRMFLDSFEGKKLPFTAATLCNAAAGGLENLCRSLSGGMGKADLASCLKKFPSGMDDCSGDMACLDTLQAYTAIKSWQPGSCPEAYRAQCQAVVSGDPAVCRQVEQQISALYCGFSAGGSPKLGDSGASARIVDAMRRFEEEKAYNAKVRKMLKEFNEEGERMAREEREQGRRGAGFAAPMQGGQ